MTKKKKKKGWGRGGGGEDTLKLAAHILSIRRKIVYDWICMDPIFRAGYAIKEWEKATDNYRMTTIIWNFHWKSHKVLFNHA